MYYTHAHIIYVVFSRICSTCCKGPSDDAPPGVEAPATSYSTTDTSSSPLRWMWGIFESAFCLLKELFNVYSWRDPNG